MFFFCHISAPRFEIGFLKDSAKEKKGKIIQEYLPSFHLIYPIIPPLDLPIFLPSSIFSVQRPYRVFLTFPTFYLSPSLSFPDHHQHHNHNDRHFYHFSFYYFSIKLTLWGSSSFSPSTRRQKKSDAQKSFHLILLHKFAQPSPSPFFSLRWEGKSAPPPVLRDPSFLAALYINGERKKRKSEAATEDLFKSLPFSSLFPATFSGATWDCRGGMGLRREQIK